MMGEADKLSSQKSIEVIKTVTKNCNVPVIFGVSAPGFSAMTMVSDAAMEAGARRISILCGNGGMYLLEELLRGADGAMTGFDYPEIMSQVMNAFNTGNLDQAWDIFDAYLPMIRYEAQPGMGLSSRKYSLTKQGVIAHPTLRKPRTLLTQDTISEIDSLAQRQEKRLRELGV